MNPAGTRVHPRRSRRRVKFGVAGKLLPNDARSIISSPTSFFGSKTEDRGKKMAKIPDVFDL